MDESYPARSFSMKAEWLVAGTHNADVGSGVIHAGNIMSASASAFLGTDIRMHNRGPPDTLHSASGLQSTGIAGVA